MVNLRKNRHHHASLLILASLLPRLPRYEDLYRVMNRMPGIRVGGPEYVATLAFLPAKMGRQGGKLDYLLHVLGGVPAPQAAGQPRGTPGPGGAGHGVGQPGTRRQGYYEQALKLRPQDQTIAKLLLQCQMAQKQWGQALTLMEKQGQNPANAPGDGPPVLDAGPI